jgi:hypothetical protein
MQKYEYFPVSVFIVFREDVVFIVATYFGPGVVERAWKRVIG